MVACDSTQPARVEEQTATLTLTAVNGSVLGFVVWQSFEDNDGNLQPDDGEFHPFCDDRQPNGQPVLDISAASVPWGFSTEITIIRAGTSNREVITSTDALTPNFNVAEYDTTTNLPVIGTKQPVLVCGDVPLQPGEQCDPIEDLRTFRFTNPRRLPAVNLEVMNAPPSPLFEILQSADSSLGLGDGLCSVGNPGASRLDDQELPYTVVLNKGDTIVFKARISDSLQTGTGLNTVVQSFPTALGTTLQIDGRTVAVNGNTAGTAVSFSYTSR